MVEHCLRQQWSPEQAAGWKFVVSSFRKHMMVGLLNLHPHVAKCANSLGINGLKSEVAEPRMPHLEEKGCYFGIVQNRQQNADGSLRTRIDTVYFQLMLRVPDLNGEIDQCRDYRCGPNHFSNCSNRFPVHIEITVA